jgi:hypothetical protein
MKNLLYYIVNDNYKSILQYNLSYLRKHLKDTNIDVCCIVPENSSIIREQHLYSLNEIYEINPFDYRYTAKFLIGEWPKHELYENFLYLDTDAIPVKDVSLLFEEINNSPDFLHGVIEALCLNKESHYHRFSGTVFPESAPAYNAGTFGFNKKLIPKFKSFVEYINTNRSKAHLDQSLFNEFFTQENCFASTLSKYTFLFNKDNIYKNINKITIQDATIIHFLGNAYSGKSTITIDNQLKQNNIL